MCRCGTLTRVGHTIDNKCRELRLSWALRLVEHFFCDFFRNRKISWALQLNGKDFLPCLQVFYDFPEFVGIIYHIHNAVPFRNRERITFDHLVSMKKLNEKAIVRVMRDSQELELSIILQPVSFIYIYWTTLYYATPTKLYRLIENLFSSF